MCAVVAGWRYTLAVTWVREKEKPTVVLDRLWEQVKKLFFATWKVRLSPTAVRETYRRRFGIETSYRQLNQSRSRTSSRDPLYRFLLVGVSLFLRNLWQWLVSMTKRSGTRVKKTASANPPRYHDILDDFSDYLWRLTQTHNSQRSIS